MAYKAPEPGFFFDPDTLALLQKAFGATLPAPEGHKRLRDPPDQTTLTPRERLVLAEIMLGLSSKEVARSLEISPRTVEFHRANLLKKYGAKNTAELMRKVLG
ncbi:LuxR family transcriptional regulator [Methyloceanibacter sp.]|uniref:response regulator transcription factor n=1 Tax=Methyloceanibacter sp. TaxID=1965321 RepID=UPI002D6DB47D|nr:LuxR family transcriptional regulator [Methyloceanibacter sp.]HZP08899.1 LuxR family transcriptional regulator [Methyloceanibacter sp.]